MGASVLEETAPSVFQDRQIIVRYSLLNIRGSRFIAEVPACAASPEKFYTNIIEVIKLFTRNN